MKTDALYRKLHAAVSTQPVGSRLPSVRRLMQLYGVSQSTVDGALRRLKMENLIVSRPGAGLFTGIAQTGGAISTLRVGLIMQDSPSYFNALLMQTLYKSLQPSFPQLQAYYYHSGDRFGSFVRPLRIDAAVVIPNQVLFNDSDRQACESRPYPVIMIDSPGLCAELDGINGDNYLGGVLAARHLTESGYRKFVVLVAEPRDVQPIRGRLDGFRSEVQRYGLPAAKELFSWSADGDILAESHRLMLDFFTGESRLKSAQRTGVFLLNSYSALAVCKAAAEAGLRIPEDLGLLGYDCQPELAYLPAPLSYIHQNLPAWGPEVLRVLQERLDGRKQPPVEIRIAPALHAAASTGESAHSLR